MGSGAEVGGIVVRFTQDSVDTSPVDYDIVRSYSPITSSSPTAILIRIHATK